MKESQAKEVVDVCCSDEDEDFETIPTLNFNSKDAASSSTLAINDPSQNNGININQMQHLNEDQQLLLKVEEFNMQQAVLRTKLRVRNNREEAIDFIAKVIFMIYGLMPLEIDSFLSAEFRQSHLLYPALDLNQLERLLQEIGDYEQILPADENEKFREYWMAHRELCKLQQEKKRLGVVVDASSIMMATSGSGADRLFRE